MARPETISIPIDMPPDEACAFAELLKRTSYGDCLRRSNRNKRYRRPRGGGCHVVRAANGREPIRRGRLRATITTLAGHPCRPFPSPDCTKGIHFRCSCPKYRWKTQ
jgi:hypothetical protein